MKVAALDLATHHSYLKRDNISLNWKFYLNPPFTQINWNHCNAHALMGETKEQTEVHVKYWNESY
jgi:hypothetical protein